MIIGMNKTFRFFFQKRKLKGATALRLSGPTHASPPLSRRRNTAPRTQRLLLLLLLPRGAFSHPALPPARHRVLLGRHRAGAARLAGHRHGRRGLRVPQPIRVHRASPAPAPAPAPATAPAAAPAPAPAPLAARLAARGKAARAQQATAGRGRRWVPRDGAGRVRCFAVRARGCCYGGSDRDRFAPPRLPRCPQRLLPDCARLPAQHAGGRLAAQLAYHPFRARAPAPARRAAKWLLTGRACCAGD